VLGIQNNVRSKKMLGNFSIITVKKSSSSFLQCTGNFSSIFEGFLFGCQRLELISLEFGGRRFRTWHNWYCLVANRPKFSSSFHVITLNSDFYRWDLLNGFLPILLYNLWKLGTFTAREIIHVMHEPGKQICKKIKKSKNIL